MYGGQYYNYSPYEDESLEEECEHCSRQELHFRAEPFRYEEPPWAGHIKEKGDVFYIEPFDEPSSNELQESMEELDISRKGQDDRDKDKSKHGLRNLASVKKIIPGLSKRDKADDKVNNEKISKHSSSEETVEGLNNVNKLTGSFFKRDVQLIVVPPKVQAGSKNGLETLLGIIPGRDKAGKLSQNDSYPGSRLFIKGFVPDGPALRSGELRIGDVLLSLNKLDLNSSNVHTIFAAITGRMENDAFRDKAHEESTLGHKPPKHTLTSKGQLA